MWGNCSVRLLLNGIKENELHRIPVPFHTDTVISAADQGDMSSVLFLVSASPVALFPPTDWQKPQLAADPKGFIQTDM